MCAVVAVNCDASPLKDFIYFIRISTGKYRMKNFM
jgi:hypothetical protein